MSSMYLHSYRCDIACICCTSCICTCCDVDNALDEVEVKEDAESIDGDAKAAVMAELPPNPDIIPNRLLVLPLVLL